MTLVGTGQIKGQAERRFKRRTQTTRQTRTLRKGGSSRAARTIRVVAISALRKFRRRAKRFGDGNTHGRDVSFTTFVPLTITRADFSQREKFYRTNGRNSRDA